MCSPGLVDVAPIMYDAIVYINPSQNIKSQSVKVLDIPPLYVEYDAGPFALRPGALQVASLEN